MLDLSDGLAADVRHLAAASDARMDIDLSRVPLDDLTVKRDANESHRRNANSVHTLLTLAQLESMPEFRYE